MNILVTGSEGYIGKMLVPELDKEHNTIQVDIGWFDEESTFKHFNFKDLVSKDLEGIDCIIHLAGLSNDPSAEYRTDLNYEINSSQTILLAHKAKEAGVKRFIFASSCSVYGFVSGPKASKETDSPNPKYPYGISKLMAEVGLMALMDNNFLVTILRKGTVGGYSPRMRFDLVVNTMTKSALLHNRILVKNASLWRPVIDIRDVVRAYSMVVQKEAIGIHNIVQGNYTILQIGQLVSDAIKEVTGRHPDLEILDMVDLRNYKAEGSKALESFGFSPLYSIKDTVREILNHLEEYGDLNQKKFYNIEVMKEVLS